VASYPPVVIGCMLVIPEDCVAPVLPDDLGVTTTFSIDPVARRRIELAGMRAVMDSEKAMGNTPRDVSSKNLGWDIESKTPDGALRFLEVKGRHHEATTVTVSKNEMLVAFNKRDENNWFLVIVLVNPDGTTQTPTYVASPFDREPSWAETSVNLEIAKLLSA